MQTYQDIHYLEQDGLATIRFNRPDVLNAIRVQTYQELIQALEQADQSDAVKVIILTGTQHAFTAGNDLADLLPDGDIEGVQQGVAGIFNQLSGLEKPLICAQEGLAIGIGANILLHADLAVAGQSTRYALPFARIGVTSEGASSVLLQEAIGPKAASELLLTGRFFSADEAKQWGLLNQVVEDGSALEAAQTLAKQLLQNSIDSLREIKALGRAEYHQQRVNDTVAREMQRFAQLLTTPETQARIHTVLKRQK